MDSLEESYRERCNNLVFINVQPAFGDLRSISRFTDLIQRMGLVSVPSMPANKTKTARSRLSQFQYHNLSPFQGDRSDIS